MDTIYAVLYYLNKLDFTDKVNDDDLENSRCVKRILVREFEDYNLEKTNRGFMSSRSFTCFDRNSESG